MSGLAPLVVGVPLLGASLLAMTHSLLGRLGADVLAIGLAVASAVMSLLLLLHVRHGLQVYWFGGWHPHHGVAIGIDFSVDAIGAGLALFIAVLMVLALLFSTRHIGVEAPYYHVLMLTFMAGMIGFCLSGDLFNLFVMFELMSVSVVALIGYKIHERAALEGALNFAVINMIGSFLFLLGIGLTYSRTGALNLAQIGRALGHTGDDRVVVIAFTLIAAALLIKAAVVPYHFWLDDAYAVALSPVCLLLAGAMSEIGLYGVARIWFTAFLPAFRDHIELVRAIFLGVGCVTALWGGAMALGEDHLKRMLAFVTISFVGVFLLGIGLLTEEGVAGTGLYVIADGFGKALLFACVGIVQNRRGSVSQRRLRGRARDLTGTGALFLAGGLLIAAIPPFGPFLGKSMIEDAAIHAGDGFIAPVIVLASALCGGAVLRSGARIFLGWGRPVGGSGDADDDTEPETDQLHERTPATMSIAAVLLLAGAVGTGVWFGFADLVTGAAHQFVQGHAYDAGVFGAAGPGGTAESSAPEWFDWLFCAGSTGLAVAIAAAGLWGGRSGAVRRLDRLAGAVIGPVKRLHTGRIGDYTAALLLGTGLLTVLMMATLR